MATPGSWTALAGYIGAFMLAAFLLLIVALAMLQIGTWAVNRVFGEPKFKALGVLLAVMGGLAALYQARSASVEAGNEKARLLAVAEGCVKGLVFETMFGKETPNDSGAIPVTQLQRELPQMRSYTKALNDVELKSLPSALSMMAVVKARARATALVEKAERPGKGQATVDLDREIAALAGSEAELEREEARLFPTYQVGPVLLGGPLSMR